MKQTAKVQFSMATNASTLDADRLRVVIPHWLRTFAGSLTELTVVVESDASHWTDRSTTWFDRLS